MSLDKTLEEIFKDNYVIPLYQRSFAWREEEIERLLHDIYQNFKSAPETNYYIGSLTVFRRNDGIFEVIDGQQRITVISLLAKIVGLSKNIVLSYDSRPEIMQFLQDFYRLEDSNLIEYKKNIAYSANLVYFYQAVNTLLYTHLDPNDDKSPVLAKQDCLGDFIEYIKKKVVFIRVETPLDTDVASYFEIMNNRGEQLQKHEILKSLMMSSIKNKDKQKLFSKIWTACSQMDIPIQKLFSINDRKVFFGHNYNSFNSPKCTCRFENVTNNSFSINDIFSSKVNFEAYSEDEDIDNENIEDESDYKAIIDFPNFIMHIFKICYEKEYMEKTKEEISLDEKFLLSTYEIIKNLKSFDAIKFANRLLFFRTCMERFVILSKDDEKKEDNFEWVLQQPYKNKNCLKFKNSFEDGIQEYLIKALSMLQVAFRTRKYKNWLQKVLCYFNTGINLNEINGSNYLSFLHQWMEDYFDERFITSPDEIIDVESWEFKQKGTQTPHFLFNFIDYLYWLRNTKKFKFSFKYHNSIEHHLPQSYKRYIKSINISDDLIDNLGNLCLVSKSANSKMSDRLPLDKSSRENKFADDNIGPKRFLMCETTNKNKNWAKKEILEHYEDVVQLLNNRKNILGLT